MECFADGSFPARASWLLREIGGFLVQDSGADEQLAAARVALRNGQRDFAAFTASRCLPEDTVGAQLVVRRDGEVAHRSWYRRVPSPIGLLVLCSSTCREGDHVSFVQSTAGCGRVTTSEDWPFGLACTEQMTVPASVRLASAAHAAGIEVRAVDQVSRGSAGTGTGSRPLGE